MSGQTAEVVQPKSQQDFHQQESTCPRSDNTVEALQNQPPVPDVSSQDTSTQLFHLHESHPHQTDVLPSPSTISANTLLQRHTGSSVCSAGGPGIDQEPAAASIPASHTRLEPAVDDGPILSQGCLISAEQPSPGCAESKSESQTSTAPRVYDPFWRVWWKEMLCIVVSIASFVAIVVVIASYDGHSLPKWPLTITLNTFLAFFTTLAKVAFMLSTSSALSQFKFTWFMEPRPLYDFYVFDQASRGLLGSMKMLYRVRLKHTVTIGAILMVISVLSSPVTQLAISYSTHNATAAGGQAKIFTINEINLDKYKLGHVVELAAFKATVPDTGNFDVPVPPQKASCSTGNCDFNPYQSLGVCVAFANITSKLRTGVLTNVTVDVVGGGIGRLATGLNTWKASLSDKYFFLHQNPLAVKGEVLDGVDTFGFSNNTDLLSTRIASFFLIYTSPLPPNGTSVNLSDSDDAQSMIRSISDFTYEAHEVMFHICVQTFETKVRTGVEETFITDTSLKPDDTSKGIVLRPNCTPLEQESETCDLPKEQGDLLLQITTPNTGTKKFSVSYASMQSIARGLSYLLEGEGELPIKRTGLVWIGNFARTWFRDVLYTNQDIFNSTRRATHLDNFFLDIATRISSDLRTAHHQAKRSGAVIIEGTPLEKISYVHIKWGWVSFLAVEVVAATLFLIMVITTQSVTSRQQGTKDVYVPADVKDSALANLVVLSNDCREALSDGLQPADDLQKTSKKLQVTLRGNEIVIAADLEVQSSHPSKENPQEADTEEHSLPKNRPFDRILTSIRAW
ncbi:hypothetical protein CNYM01_03580 [Colletotrichum nymphaeae SA-01]|uniref:Uncharacterized protein n=1 Tax=Colletotrichum nymphaeae SA-01 TaxID=1460502 RepID=A0A135SR96_9PEZI|nr:hypothetical protein CNYM01_03580 [Colletotrichum nymphaeae SA-01]